MSRGILYIATGDEFIQEAIQSAKQADTVVDVPIAIITNREIDNPIFDQVIVDSNPQYSYLDKPRGFQKSPFDKTLFLDTDTYIISPIDELFDLLDCFDMAATVDPNEASLRMRDLQYFDTVPESVPEYNTGVVAFSNNPKVSAFVDSWIRNYSESQHTDQPSFRKALHTSSVKFTALSPVYNCFTNYPMQITGTVKILHDVGNDSFLREGDNVNERIQEVADRINRTEEIRILHTVREDTLYVKSKFGDQVTHQLRIINKLFLLLIENGFKRTGKLILNKFRKI